MYRFAIALLLCFSLCLSPGCPGDDDDSGDDDATGDDDTGDDDSAGDDDTTPVAFEIEGDGIYPADGATDAYARTPVLVRFTTAADSATLSMTDGDTGDPVDGTTEMTPCGRQLVFQPSEPLALEHGYSLSVEATGGEDRDEVTQDWEIVTSRTGDPLDHPQILDDRAYILELQDPRSTLSLLPDEFLPSFDMHALIGITALDPATGNLEVIGAFADDPHGTEHYCRESIEFPVADFQPLDDPLVGLGPQDLLFTVQGFEVQVFGAEIQGTFTPDGSAVDGVRLRGALDTDGLKSLLDDEPCELMSAVTGISCEPCPDDGDPACVPIDLVDLGGAEAGGPLHTITATQTENHLCGNCEDGQDNDNDGVMDDNELECHSDVWP